MVDVPDDDNTRTHVPLTSGAVVSHYTIVSKIGAGGMGEVYLADDTELDRKVALKFLPSRMCQDEDCRTRFKREAQAAAGLDHPNIAAVHEVSEHQGRPYYAMQLIEGQSLREVITGKDLSIERILEIAIQVCEGLQAAHDKGIIHRDIKPSNILLDSHSRVRIVDFGLAAVRGSEHLTKTGSTLGTVGYMSPEQVRGQDVDKRSDLFSLGVVLYELITGQSPFKRENEAATLKAVSDDTPHPVARYRANVPDGLQAIIDKALDKDCSTRYQHADEILADLRRLTGSSSVEGAAEGAASHFSGKKSRWKAIALSLVVFAIAILAVTLMWPDSTSDLSEHRVAVAVFKNQTGQESLDHIGHMAADWIGQGLSQTSLVAVVPPMMAAMASGELDGSDGIRKFADATGARIVVSGSYYQQGDTLFFQAQVTDAEKGELLRALQPVMGNVDDPVAVIELLRQRLMGTLATILHANLDLFLDASVDPPLYAAYTEFLRGSSKFREIDMRGAMSHYYRAFAIDSTFSQAMFMAALTHLNLGQNALADSAAREVRKFEDRLTPLSRGAFDWIQAYLRGDRVAALKACRLGRELAPGSPMHFQQGLEALWLNHIEEAIETMTSIDPQEPTMKGWQPYWYWMSRAYHDSGDRVNEQETIDSWKELFPGTHRSLIAEIRLFAAKGQPDSIQQRLDGTQSLSNFPFMSEGSFMLLAGTELRCHGYKEASVGLIRNAVDWFRSHEPVDSAGLASALYAAEEWEEAQRLFNKLLNDHPDSVVYLGHMGVLAVRMGDEHETERVAELLEGVQDPYIHGEHTYWLAAMEALKGNKKEAVDLLRKSLDEGRKFTDLHADINLESLLDHPDYVTLTAPKPMERH